MSLPTKKEVPSSEYIENSMSLIMKNKLRKSMLNKRVPRN